MKYSIFTFLFSIISITVIAQERINWDILADVSFVSEYVEEMGTMQSISRFGEDPKEREGKEISITGYTIPIDGTGTYYVLSKFPYANCYFCGGAGPETIIELSLKPDAQRRFETDERVTVTGKLQLNENDVYRLPYLVVEATVEPLN
ncbi:MAG: DUF3299 domain-containing protein [Bacteroidota bacterium]